MVCGAEFRAETHALCSRVKSINLQLSERYPHMPNSDIHMTVALHRVVLWQGITCSLCEETYRPKPRCLWKMY